MPAALHERLLSEHDSLIVSAVNAWEMSTKFQLGNLPEAAPLLRDFGAVADQLGASVLTINPAHTVRARALAWAHRDPFDRMLVAQALEDGLQVATLDERVTGWAGAPLLSWRSV